MKCHAITAMSSRKRQESGQLLMRDEDFRLLARYLAFCGSGSVTFKT